MESRLRGRRSFLGRPFRSMFFTIAALLFLLIGGATSVSALDVQQAIDNGVNWLVTHQGPNGGWEPFSTSYSNALAIRAYVATGNVSLSKCQLLLSKLKELQATNGSWDEDVQVTSEAIWSLIEVGESSDSLIIQSAVVWLKRQQNADGGWGAKGAQSYTGSTSFAIIALMKAGEPKDSQIVLNGVNWLKVNQNTDGFWGTVPGDKSVDWQTPAVIALALADSPSSPEVQRALAWIENRYSGWHGWYAISGLEVFIAVNSTSNIENAVNKVVSEQNPDYGWSHQPYWPSCNRETAMAVRALIMAGYKGTAIDTGMVWIENHISIDGVYIGDYEIVPPTSWSISGLSVTQNPALSLVIQRATELLLNTQSGGWRWWSTVYPTVGDEVSPTGLAAWALYNSGISPFSTALQQAASFLQSAQNGDGGWGWGRSGTASTVGTTNYALMGLICAGYATSDKAIVDGLDYLVSKATDANWGNTFDTALATIILQKLSGGTTLLDRLITLLKENAVAWLKANQNADGGWGSVIGESSTVNDTSMVLIALNSTGETGIDMVRGASWLVAAQNIDGGWSNLPGVPSSNPTSTALAIWALSAQPYLMPLEVDITTDKVNYYQGETATITVTASDTISIYQLEGTVTDPEAWVSSLTFTETDTNTFTSYYYTTTSSPMGTYTIAVEASTEGGRTGVATKNFNVLYTIPSVRPEPNMVFDILQMKIHWVEKNKLTIHGEIPELPAGVANQYDLLPEGTIVTIEIPTATDPNRYAVGQDIVNFNGYKNLWDTKKEKGDSK